MSVLVIESNAVPFTVRIVQKGDSYGTNFCLQHDKDEPIVEFYDGRFKDEQRFTRYGQFVSRYYARTLLESPAITEQGLNLEGGVPAWQIDRAGIAAVRRWLADELRRDS